MSTEKINIFIVEDEGITALALEDTLTSEGYEVVGTADNGQEALNIIKEKQVDLALLDIHLKGQPNGIETAQRLSAIKNIPFIFLTAYSDDETVAQASETNPSAFLIKPFQPRHLLVTIGLALHNFALRQKSPETPASTWTTKDQIQQPLPSGELLLFNQYLFVKQNNQYVKLKLEYIQYLKADGNYTHLFVGNKAYAIRQSLGDTLVEINYSPLLRIHRSFAVNFNKITEFNAYTVFLDKHTQLPIGRKYKEIFLSYFNQGTKPKHPQP